MIVPHNTPTGLISRANNDTILPPLVLPSPLPRSPVLDLKSIPWVDSPRECDSPLIELLMQGESKSPKSDMTSPAHKLSLG